MPKTTLLEMLLRAGLINEAQCDEALQNRVLHGGRIGTSLIELGFVGEENLARFLSRKLSVPYISPGHLKDISPEIIAKIPQSLALKYQAIPIKYDKKKLALAMVDPADLQAVDEISFATGFMIRPVVAPEVRLMEALAVYYEARMLPRYREIIGYLEEERTKAAALAEEAEKAEKKATTDAATAAAAQPEAVTEISLQEEPVAQPSAVADAVETGDDMRMAEIVEEEGGDPAKKISIDDMAQKLSWARDREEIALALMAYMNCRFGRSALFTLLGGAAYGWKAAHEETEIQLFNQFRLPLDSPSVLKTVAESREGHLGPIPETISNALLQEALRSDGPDQVLVLPIFVAGNIVGIVYGEGAEDMAAECRELKKILFKTGLAFEILICREKIQMITGNEDKENPSEKIGR
ncbi:MAG: hypothetical protein WDA20_12665 [Desulfuromonadales bacterium]